MADIDAENAKQDALLRKERKAYEEYKAREKAENEAPRQAIKDAAKRIGRDTVKSMGLDPDVDYGAIAKKKLSDFGIEAGVALRDIGRSHQEAYGGKPTPYEGEQGAKKLREARDEMRRETRGMKKGGAVKSASSRADGIAQRGKTRGRML